MIDNIFKHDCFVTGDEADTSCSVTFHFNVVFSRFELDRLVDVLNVELGRMKVVDSLAITDSQSFEMFDQVI